MIVGVGVGVGVTIADIENADTDFENLKMGVEVSWSVRHTFTKIGHLIF